MRIVKATEIHEGDTVILEGRPQTVTSILAWNDRVLGVEYYIEASETFHTEYVVIDADVEVTIEGGVRADDAQIVAKYCALVERYRSGDRTPGLGTQMAAFEGAGVRVLGMDFYGEVETWREARVG